MYIIIVICVAVRRHFHDRFILPTVRIRAVEKFKLETIGLIFK